MKIITWNVKRWNAPDKRQLIKRGLDQLRPDVVFLQETKMNKEEASLLIRSWKQWTGAFMDSEGASGGLGILWNPNNHKVEEVFVSPMWQVCKIHSFPLNADFILINVYGSSKPSLQREFWKPLSSLIQELEEGVIIIGGDFNAILDLNDKSGSKGGPSTSQVNFQNFVVENGLREVKSKEGQFTWSNRRILGNNVAENLDRFFLGGPWAETNLLFISNIQPMVASDHLPVELTIAFDGPPIRCPFKFEKMWLRDGSLRDLIKEWWSGAPKTFGTKAFVFVKKLQFVKSKIKEWNRIKFGNIFANKRDLEGRLAALQEEIIQKGMSSEMFLQERDLKSQYSEVLAREDIYWRQKSRECWLGEGDRNTNFFHNSVKARRSQNKITTIYNSENVLLDNL
ncbi:uncharacterized protein LOC131050696 [Cryptomeria japonica]|uniref:uncharacterized protein LOC131050696 n=1 Tax=Cryptomeria japonica TaxID=3369 RepID=UPI0027DA65B2|nr:uncharacterized protein LOC131050696 [Cryptomeria japonica]